MFQNLSNNTEDNFYEEVQTKDNERNSNTKKEILKRAFSIQNCVIYVLSFLVSIAGKETGLLSIAPFGFAIVAASVGTGIPAVLVCLISIIGTIFRSGASYILTYILTMLVFFASIIIVRPKEIIGEYEVNEQRKVALHISFSVLIVQLIPMFFKTFYVYDLLYSIMLAISTFILYKIFVNSLSVYKGLGIKKVFSIEEVIGASIIAIIAINSIGELNVFGFSIRNILNILVVLILGWKNGMLVGATGGISIGFIVTVMQNDNPVLIAAFAISGMIAGILNKLGRIGVISGFIIGNIVLAYIANGISIEIIRFEEILIAALGLLALPKSAGLTVSDLYDKYKLLPETTSRTLEENIETVNKLNNLSDTISQMAREYGEAATTAVSKEENDQIETNKESFEKELISNLEGHEENLLYNDIYNNEDEILDDIFEILTKREVITRKDIILVFAKHNNYITGFTKKSDTDYEAQKEIDDMVRIINSAYRVSKLNFILKKKINENRKSVSTQLNGVSEVISNLAEKIKNENNDSFKVEKEEIKRLLEEKDITVKDITIEKDNKFIVNLYTNVCENVDGKQCYTKKIALILSKVLKNKMILQKQNCGIREDKENCLFRFTSEDRYSMQIGIARAKKYDSIVSGDSTIKTKLEDGKYLLAISDGKGSGPEARKSSKIAIKMLERLLKSGFNKDTALKLINSIIENNTEEDMYATLDVNILDLYNGNMEFFKNGACPTFIKRNKNVEVLKSVSLPTGILDNIDLIEYNYELKDGDIIVMCSDGIIDSTKEFTNKELWIKYLLEDLETDDAQRIADIILSESRDNNCGKEKDDMSIICVRIDSKTK